MSMPNRSPEPLPHQQRAREIAERCAAIVQHCEPGEKLPTVQEMCRDLQTSASTLNRVLQAMEANGEITRLHGVGIFRASRSVRRIVLLCAPTFLGASGASPFWNLLVRETHRRIAGRGDEITFYLSLPPASVAEREREYEQNAVPPELPPALLREVESGKIAGVLCVGQGHSLTKWLEARTIPTVAYAGAARYTVGFDPTAFHRIAVAALRKSGSTRIGLWFPVTPFALNAARWVMHDRYIAAFAAVLAEFGLPFHRSLVRDNRDLIGAPGETTTLSHGEQGYRCAVEVFGAKVAPNMARPDALIVGDDMMTQGVLTALARYDVPVGANGLLIATHANRGLSFFSGYEHRLHRVETDPNATVAAICDLLDEVMSSEMAATPREIRIPYVLNNDSEEGQSRQ